MENQILIFFCGIYSLAFAVFHVLFWKIFNWKKDLQRSSAPTREIIQILNLRLIHLFLFTAFVCFFFSEELTATTLGKVMLVGTSTFWVGRTIEQFIF
jgi:hypothetical protein